MPESVLKGVISENNSISIENRGGTIDSTDLWAEDEPIFQSGEVYGIFLKNTSQSNVFQVFGKYQGVVSLIKTLEENPTDVRDQRIDIIEFQKMILRIQEPEKINKSLYPEVNLYTGIQKSLSYGAPFIDSISPSEASAGTETQIVISGHGFGTKSSRDSNADVGFFFITDQMQPNQYPMYLGKWLHREFRL